MFKCALSGISVAGVLLALLAASAFVPASAQPAHQEGNLLVNPGFEGLSCPGGSPAQAECNATHDVHIKDGIIRDNIRTPEGWVTWWREDPANGWTQPEVVIAAQIDPYLNPPRIRTGSYAMKVFGSHGAFDGGFYQVVNGLHPGVVRIPRPWPHPVRAVADQSPAAHGHRRPLPHTGSHCDAASHSLSTSG
jgi:hypothetical protein